MELACVRIAYRTVDKISPGLFSPLEGTWRNWRKCTPGENFPLYGISPAEEFENFAVTTVVRLHVRVIRLRSLEVYVF